MEECDTEAARGNGIEVIDERARFLRSVPLFEGLDEAHVEALARVTASRRFPRGTTVFFEGDRGESLYIVRSGCVKIYRVAEDGREKTLALLGDGEFFGEMALLDEEPRSAVAECLEPTTLYILHRNDFRRLLSENASMSLKILRVMSRRLRQTNAQVSDLVFKDVRARVSRALLDLAKRHGVSVESGAKVALKLTHQELANLVGTARETVSRILAEFQDAHYITFEGRYVVVVDREGLMQVASP